MTKEQALTLLAAYCTERQSRLEPSTKAPTEWWPRMRWWWRIRVVGPAVRPLATDTHLVTMIDRWRESGSKSKAMRWLGYMQGALHYSHIYSLDEIKLHSRILSCNPDEATLAAVLSLKSGRIGAYEKNSYPGDAEVVVSRLHDALDQCDTPEEGLAAIKAVQELVGF